MRNPMQPRRRHSFSSLIVGYMIFVLVVSGVLTGISCILLIFFGFIPGILLGHMMTPLMPIPMIIIFAMMLSVRFGKSKLKPVNDVVHAMRQVSRGDFSVRVDEANVHGDIGELVHSYNNMAQELGSIEMFRKDFINNFSHEFKTPIVSIRGFAKQLERDDLTDEQKAEYVRIIVSESERLANMSANILLLTKLENQQIVTDKAEYALDEQLRNCILLLEKDWTAKEIELCLTLDEVTYNGNEEMMSHVWVNLINNAIKFSPKGSMMEITCMHQGGAAVVSVRDHGEGMDEATRKRVFEKFYQGDTAHATQGNGLGLSLVKRIVDLCNGENTVESSPGEGTCFTVVLPDSPAK